MEDLSQRVTKVETKVEEHQRLLNAQAEKNDTLTRLAILIERQQEESKERERRQELRDEVQNKQLEKFATTLEKVNDNLTTLNNRQEQLNNNQLQLGQRVDHIENTLSEQTISTNTIFKGFLKHSLLGLGTLIGGFILGWLLFRFGISGGINH